MRKDLNYYLELSYPIEIIKIPEDEGGGYSACIPFLGRNAFIADGESIEEAIQNLEIIKEDNFERMLEKGIPIPEPEVQKEEEYSGKFLARVPKELHRELARNANKNGISLNQFVQYIITKGLLLTSFEEITESYCTKFENVLNEMKKVEYHFLEKSDYKEFTSANLHFIIGEKKDSEYQIYSKVG
ncbi:MAG: type II toxin-antitoxin system HicB family antitoxin [Ignavibacterium sp.]|nr:type II toxin-antitoxin system HicB family antitoxin [Ignavibacterium sp.]